MTITNWLSQGLMEDISVVNGTINQLISGGHHLAGIGYEMALPNKRIKV